jgi:hypothetical protein
MSQPFRRTFEVNQMHPSRPRPAAALLRLAAAVVFAALTVIGVAAGPAGAADDGVPWAVRTASNSFGSDRPNYGYTVNPGGHVDDALVVVNHGTTPLDLAVYAADGFTTRAGQLDLTTADMPADDVGAWTHAGRDHVRVEPGESVEVPFTVMVPADAEPGDHLGGIVTSLTQPDEATGVDVDRRLAISIRLRVSGALEPGLSVEHVGMHYSGTANPFGKGDAVVSYTLHNTGNTLVAARQSASVTGPFGSWKARAVPIEDSPQLLPGESWQVSARVHGVTPAMRLTATVTALPLVTDAAGSTGTLASIESSTHGWTVPWTLLALLVACGIALVLAVRRVGRRRTVQPQVSEPSVRDRTTVG